MSSSNYRNNKAIIDKFRNELIAELGEIKDIDKKIITRAVNDGLSRIKKNTPVGLHPNPVTFTVRNGKEAGTVVSFKVSNPGTGGFLRQSWRKTPTVKATDGTQTELINTADYASYWNDGHRIVTRVGGPTKGFVKGTHELEKTVSYINKRMIALFKAEIERIGMKYDK